MTKISEAINKTSPVANDVVPILDSEATDNNKKNKKTTFGSLWSAIFGSRTSDDIPEWTNSLYATEANLNDSATIQALQNNKADKTNVLELDNTTAYTPTATYHPATKEYVDTRSLPDATTTQKGVAELATTSETHNKSVSDKIVTPNNLIWNTWWFKVSGVSAVWIEGGWYVTTWNYVTISTQTIATLHWQCTHPQFIFSVDWWNVTIDGADNRVYDYSELGNTNEYRGSVSFILNPWTYRVRVELPFQVWTQDVSAWLTFW